MILQLNPFRVPTGDDKIIEEHFGKASQGGDQLSLARMEAPPRWTEPFQTPEFDEYTLVYSGRCRLRSMGRPMCWKQNSRSSSKGEAVYAIPIPSINLHTIVRFAFPPSPRKL